MFERFADNRPPPSTSPRSAGHRARILAILAALIAIGPAAAQDGSVTLPPPPGAPTTAPLDVPARAAPPAATPASPSPTAERCTGCHSALTQAGVVHGAVRKHDCRTCHTPAVGEAGKCRAKTATKWNLIRSEPELCYGCHARKDESKSVHTVVRQGSCLACHAAHASPYVGLLTSPREKVCFDCHDSLATGPVKHAPAAEGLCLGCHDPHGGDLPNAIKATSGSAFCLKCHDAKAPTGKGSPGPGFRVDLGKPNVHAALKRMDCSGCHDAGHSSDTARLLKKPAAELCYGCHNRKDRSKFPHGAVLVGDCVTCHDPHSSDNAKLLAKATIAETCFACHQDDVTGRKVVHAPVKTGCQACHEPHGAPNPFALKGGEGKAACYACHKPLDEGKVRHAPLDRYGCTGCHDPHGTANPGLLATKVNALCTSCHADRKDGRHVTALIATGHVVDGDLSDPRRTGRRFSCASCHNPHGSNSPSLLYYGENTMQSCDWCHGDKTGKRPELKDVASNARKNPVPRTNTASTPTTTGAGGGDGVTP